ncbi:MAG: flagellar basal-body rod protein FlgF [Proteobacteria bacterium]|nr:flagellar basal-body rod protein FlgF [Pseudomonadota bacterium]
MENTIYIGLSRLSALQEHMNLIANNIANVNTPGYKANKILFAEYLDKPKGMKETISMVLDYSNYRVRENGPIKRTDNPLDVAVEGVGYLGVQAPGGQIMYTRNGTFALNASRQLVTQQGYPVVDNGGQPITMPEGQGDILIDQTGSIALGNEIVGTLMVHEFPNIDLLKPVGNSLYKSDAPGTPSPSTRIIQGAIEGSNTQGVLEMTDMIDVSRTYQSVARMLQSEHDRMRSTIRTMTSNS